MQVYYILHIAFFIYLCICFCTSVSLFSDIPDYICLMDFVPEQYLHVFLSDGYIQPDNNHVKQAILPFTIDRKNFLLIESDHETKISAMIYSLVETAIANGINTYKYFEMRLTEISKHTKGKDLSFIDELLLWSSLVQKECPSQYQKS